MGGGGGEGVRKNGGELELDKEQGNRWMLGEWEKYTDHNRWRKREGRLR